MSMEDLAGRRIFIVEDESLIAMLIEDQLDELGCIPAGHVTCVEDALACLDSTELDAAVLDVNLAGQPSYPIAELLNARHVPFLFITGYGRAGLVPEFQDKPVLQKPFTSEALAQALTELLPAVRH